MYVVLVLVILAGTAATLISAVNPSGGLPPVNGHEVHFNYRETISVWFRSLFYFHPEVALMVNIPVAFKIHIVVAMVLFIIWPFTRLVHALTVPCTTSSAPTPCTALVAASVLVHVEVGIPVGTLPRERADPLIHISILQKRKYEHPCCTELRPEEWSAP